VAPYRERVPNPEISPETGGSAPGPPAGKPLEPSGAVRKGGGRLEYPLDSDRS